MCKPIWFNDKRNYFILQFSDGGAPESSQLIMSIKWQPNDMEFWRQGEKQGFPVHFTLCQSWRRNMKYCKASGSNTLMKWKC